MHVLSWSVVVFASLALGCGSHRDADADVDSDVDGGANDCPTRIFDGDYAISDVAQLAPLTGYTTVTKELSISAPLRSLAGLECLRTVGGLLISSEGLTDLAGMSRLRSVSGYYSLTIGWEGGLYISGNEALTNLDGLNVLEDVHGDVVVADNPTLPTCRAEAFVDRLRRNGWQGQSEIWGNDDAAACP